MGNMEVCHRKFQTTRQCHDNYVAGIRTIIFINYMVTNAFIVSGVIRHWNDVPSSVPKTEEKGFAKHQATFIKIDDAIFGNKLLTKQGCKTFKF